MCSFVPILTALLSTLIRYTTYMWTVIDWLKRFFSDLYHATIFAAIEYDEHLQMTKTTTQRFLIWVVIGVVLLTIAIGLLYLIWYFLDAIQVSEL
ncbi:MAG: hypothetical protein US54_C0001G0057 [Candidatus Roizmanbacteria bacterium GW2011_GWA2_37_7]|uniref:Uncharacterized protein n=1 Tax=Candidatus Roizmanbacteria bacterium GW2011_GWA2_37_7 TaxID=1618481 RepID=A0A0G0H9W7_9BACT|nr:MAG: hypothetical protein US54_C0001G0057 [Candidatus Roizmanbacteria bacterium GW2011_GWA2_37_7]